MSCKVSCAHSVVNAYLIPHSVSHDGFIQTHPIAGTRPRGKNKSLDLQLEKELLADEKERAEHIMLVDLGRNDVNRVAIPASVKVDALMVIERYSHVMHIVSKVLFRGL